MVADGKEGELYLLDMNDLGGVGQGPGGTDKVVAEVGPYGGVWSKPAVWGGDGGYVYLPTASPGAAGSGIERQPRRVPAGGRRGGQRGAEPGRAGGEPVRLLVELAGGHLRRHHVGIGGGLDRARRPTRRAWVRRCRPTRRCRRAGCSSSSGARPSATRAPAPSSTRPRSTPAASTSARVTARSSASARSPARRRSPPTSCRSRRPASATPRRRRPRSPRAGRSRSTRSRSTTPRRRRRRCSPRARRIRRSPTSLTAGQTLTVPLTFSPAAIGLETGTLTANTDAGAVDLPLGGLGSGPDGADQLHAAGSRFRHPRDRWLAREHHDHVHEHGSRSVHRDRCRRPGRSVHDHRSARDRRQRHRRARRLDRSRRHVHASGDFGEFHHRRSRPSSRSRPTWATCSFRCAAPRRHPRRSRSRRRRCTSARSRSGRPSC